MRKITWGELSNVLDLHKKWLEGKPGGVCANLSNYDLRFANLRFADLRFADLRFANLRGANLKGANLKGSNLRFANLRGSNLRGANLSGADLRGSNLDNVYTDETTSFFALQCPEEGSFIGYKKADGKIVVLQITEDAKRNSATTRKCRCNKAKVLRIEDTKGNILNIESVKSNYDKNFIYTVGEIVEVDNFDNDRWNECSTGIHFFMTKKEAINYN